MNNASPPALIAAPTAGMGAASRAAVDRDTCIEIDDYLFEKVTNRH
jgi:hypothetical protein